MKKNVDALRLFERAPVGLAHVDPEGTITLANEAFARLAGTTAAELGGRAIGSLLAGPELGRDAADALTAALPGTPFAATLRCADGTSLGVVLRTEGNAGGPLGCVVAIAPARSTGGHRAARPAGQSAADDEVVGLVAGSVAHYLNNYLATVVTNAALLAPRIAQLPPDNGDFLSEITEAAMRAAAMIRQLLAFSREHRIPLQPLALGRHLRTLVAKLEPDLPTDLTVVCADRLEAPGIVRTDAASIDRIVANLVRNAQEAMPGGGVVEVACEEVMHEPTEGDPASGVPAGRYVVLSVSDMGSGLDGATRARLFEPFFTTKLDGERAGLGVAVVFGLARRLGGDVTVESAVGVGTTVRVFLPVEGQAGRRSGEARVMPEATGGRRRKGPRARPGAAGAASESRHAVLLVDDEVPLRVAAQKVLERLGYPVYTAGDGEQALRLFHSHAASVALVVTDLMMPGMGGRGLYEALRAEGSQVPVVFTSGLFSSDMREREALDESIPFLGKPWDVSELIRVVAALAGPPPGP